MCVCVCVCVRVRARACVCVCLCRAAYILIHGKGSFPRSSLLELWLRHFSSTHHIPCTYSEFFCHRLTKFLLLKLYMYHYYTIQGIIFVSIHLLTCVCVCECVYVSIPLLVLNKHRPDSEDEERRKHCPCRQWASVLRDTGEREREREREASYHCDAVQNDSTMMHMICIHAHTPC